MRQFSATREKMKLKMKNNFDSRHSYRAHTLPSLYCMPETLWLPNVGIEASVLENMGPRSYNVATPKGTLQRNKSQIRAIPQKDDKPAQI